MFRDPIHNYIEVTDMVVWKLINTGAFQRLNNIKQLGGAFQIFHGAMHTRFGHSLGAFHIAKQVIERVDGLADALTEREKRLVTITALLHDIGHGPFSHASEAFLELHHETMSSRVILEDAEVREALDSIDANFAEDVVKVLQKSYPNPLLSKICSSQIDVDRMDYLLRDAYYAGVPYGTYDKDRILHVMEVTNQDFTFRESGIFAIEDFMFSRYHMRRQVYMNAKGRVFEILLFHTIKRFMQLWHDDKIERSKLYTLLYKFLTSNEESDVSDFLRLDDHDISAIEQLFIDEDDAVLSQLAHSLTKRILPKAFELPDEATYLNIQSGLQKLETQGSEVPYFIYCEKLEEQSIYYSGKGEDQILIKKSNGEIVPIEQASSVIGSLNEQFDEKKYYVYISQKYLEEGKRAYEEVLQRTGVL